MLTGVKYEKCFITSRPDGTLPVFQGIFIHTSRSKLSLTQCLKTLIMMTMIMDVI